MKKILALCLFISFLSSLNAAIYSLETLKKHDNSLAKDYYIHRLIENKSLNKQEIKGLRKHIFRYAGRIKKDIEKIIVLKPIINPATASCYNYTKNNILDANTSCQITRLGSIPFISSLSTQTRQILANKFQNSKQELTHLLLGFNTKNPMAYVVSKGDVNAFFRLYNYSSKLDTDLNINFVNKLPSHKSFKKIAQNIIIKREHPKLRYSLLEINPQNSSEDSAFYLGVNALSYRKEALAYEFFKRAYESFKLQENKDNALFWMYKIKNDENLLKKLANSKSVNIYSLYARELTNSSMPEIITPTTSDKISSFDMSNPFAWQKLAKQIKDANSTKLSTLAKEFNSKNTLSIYTYILERQSGFKQNYFIMPYYEYIKDYDISRQALILAIARQESRFIPTAISTSYALGMMQFMPFVANHIAQKELKLENFDQDDMFNPQTAYFFANHHLDYLEQNLKYPLFMAYAYNGGIGFTNRMLARDDMFKNGKFEPFLSMELVPYQESRIYGKKVLANYIVYRHLLNDNIKISSIFQDLIQSNHKEKDKS
ncbi:lytic transglycosylase domain-containing protein [Campylobacter sp. LR196d]|uniref:lytic transglycosylase domain-containing protein n=1 Tax=Campylobacter sp. LR196d TaxID=2593543 RepID=UPI001238ED93|nr:lytic transglycosylase domain-containing protein [Campylobacter sp. LR196d]KAA6224996.1 lytic transglycosylase domain-containing protein [Campylobacter sp. LR196d]